MNIRKVIREELGNIIQTDIHGKKSSPVDYTAVVLEGGESEKFEKKALQVIRGNDISLPMSWLTPNYYHMTITKGPLGLGQKMAGAIGSDVELKIHSIGVSDKAIAFGVRGLYSKNDIQHITFAFKENSRDSNDIEGWVDITPFKVVGTIKEVDKPDGWGRLKQIDESVNRGSALLSENQKYLPRQFDHLKWDFSNNQKYYLDDLCSVDPESITESDIKSASKFLNIPEKNVKSILNTYSSYDPVKEGVFEYASDSPWLIGNKPITVGDAMSVKDLNRAPVRANRTTPMASANQLKTSAEKKTMSYAKNTGRYIDKEGEQTVKEKFYENVYTSLMMYLFCELGPKDIKLNHNNQIQIDQEPKLLEGESFSMENTTYRKVNRLLESFNNIFETSFKVSDHIDLSETKHKCHRTFVEHFGISENKLFWSKNRKSWSKPGDSDYDMLKKEYIDNQNKASMPEINKVDHKEMLDKYFSGDLISYDPNADWLL